MQNQLDIDAVVRAFEGKRHIYEEFSVKLYQFLKEKLEERSIDDCLVKCRTKSIESFREKIVRPGKHYTDPLNQLTDLSGVRVIVCYIDQIAQVVDILKSEFDIDYKQSIDKSKTLKPDTFGYLSEHYIV